MKIKKHFKKLIVVLVLLMLFNFCYPKNVNASIFDQISNEIQAAPAKILWWIERGLLITLNNIFTDNNNDTDSSLELSLTPETIIKGRFLIFDANIFKNVDDLESDNNYYDIKNDAIKNGKVALRRTISEWYYGLRNFTIVALLSVLVYVGIRMVLSTLAQDKAKYKSMFKDWLIAICLVVVMHYFMIAILDVSSLVVKAMGGGTNSDIINKVVTVITDVLSADNYETDEYDLGDAYANIIVLFGIIAYIIIFAVKYLKREFTIIFLILVRTSFVYYISN